MGIKYASTHSILSPCLHCPGECKVDKALPCLTKFSLSRTCWDRFWNTWAHGHASIFISRRHLKAGNKVKWWSNQFSECVPYHNRTYTFIIQDIHVHTWHLSRAWFCHWWTLTVCLHCAKWVLTALLEKKKYN